MEQLIELLKQIQDLAGVAVDALEGAASDVKGGGKPKPEGGGGKPMMEGAGGPPMHGEPGGAPPDGDESKGGAEPRGPEEKKPGRY